MTLTLTTSSSWRSWPGVSSPSQITVSAPVASDDVAQLVGLARADVGRGVGPVAPLDQASRTSEPAVSASSLSSCIEFSASATRPVGPDADQDDPLEPELAVLDLGDVLELGRQPATRRSACRSSRSCWTSWGIALERVAVAECLCHRLSRVARCRACPETTFRAISRRGWDDVTCRSRRGRAWPRPMPGRGAVGD